MNPRASLVLVLVLVLGLLSLGACTGTRARREIRTQAAPAPIGPYSQAVEAGGALYLAGQIGVDPQSGAVVAGGIEAQTRQALRNLAAVLDAANYSRRDVVQSSVFLADLAEFEAFNSAYAEFFGDVRPARATVQVQALPRGARVEIAMIAVRAR